MKKFFDGLKVVELSSVLAGPAAGMFFAELGARVIKVENKRSGGDVSRNWRLPSEEAAGPSGYFSAANYGKEHLMLDLSEEGDRTKLDEYLKDADILISNYTPSVAAKLQLDRKRILTQNQRLIFLQLDGFFDTERPAFDVVLQAETGWIAMTGSKDVLAKLPVALIDIIAGHQLKEAALLALLKREKTGKGSYVRCTLEEASLSALENQASNYLMSGHIAKPLGTLHPNIAPYGDLFSSHDDVQFVLAAGSENQFCSLWHALFGLKPISEDFENNTSRLQNRKSLHKQLQKAFSEQLFLELEVMFYGAGIPFGEVKRMDKVMTSNAARAMLLIENVTGKKTQRLSEIGFSTDFLAD